MQDPFPAITETPGLPATARQVSMLYTRYWWAASQADGRAILEVASGSGIGLGLMAKRAKAIVAGDYSRALLHQARHQGGDTSDLVQLDAQALPFGDATFDLVVFFEALYYLARPEAFVAEARRVLRGNGALLVCTANCDRAGFVKSPHSHRYFSAPELSRLLERGGFQVRLFGAFPVGGLSPRGRLVSLARRVLVSLNLVPGTLRGRALLKRMAYGRLVGLPQRLEVGAVPTEPLVPITGQQAASSFEVLYAEARVLS